MFTLSSLILLDICVLFRESVDHLKSLFLKHGSDCWWTLDRDDLLPKSILRGVSDYLDLYELRLCNISGVAFYLKVSMYLSV